MGKLRTKRDKLVGDFGNLIRFFVILFLLGSFLILTSEYLLSLHMKIQMLGLQSFFIFFLWILSIAGSIWLTEISLSRRAQRSYYHDRRHRNKPHAVNNN